MTQKKFKNVQGSYKEIEAKKSIQEKEIQDQTKKSSS